MNRRKIKQLVSASTTKNDLDKETVNKIANLLTRKELKLYVNALRNWERQHTVIAELPKVSTGLKKQLEELYSEKKIEIREDPELLLGMRLYDNDDIYEMNLKDTLNQITDHITNAYDR